jgi:microcystin-dependent protein
MASKIDMSAVDGLEDAIPSQADIAAMIASAIASIPTAGGPEVGDYCWSARATKALWLLCTGAAVSRTTYAALYAQIGTRYGAGDGSTTFNLPASSGRTLVAAGTGTITEAVAAASWNATTDVITVPTNAEKWVTGRRVRLTTTTTLPTGLAINTDYFVIRLTATTIQLASSLANAVAGTAINFTTAGTGTHTITHTLTARALGDLGGEETHALTVTEIPAHTHDVNGSGFNSGSGPATSPDAMQAAVVPTTATGGSGAHNNMQPFQVENLFIYAGV